MQYMLLIHDDENAYQRLGERDLAALHQEYGDLTAGLRESGAYVDGNQLQPTSTATSVQVRGTERIVTDGPFAETKEQLGGYYIVEAASLDEAIDHAARIPAARVGTIEVRPVVQVPARAES